MPTDDMSKSRWMQLRILWMATSFVSEAVVARSQNRYITCDELAEDVANLA